MIEETHEQWRRLVSGETSAGGVSIAATSGGKAKMSEQEAEEAVVRHFRHFLHARQ